MIGAQSDSIGRGADGSESEKGSDTLESRAAQMIMLVVWLDHHRNCTPEAVSNHPSSVGVIGSEQGVGADTCAASGALFGSRAKSCPL